MGAKKFCMSLETQEKQTFWRDIPGFFLGYPGVPEKAREKNSLCSMFFCPRSTFCDCLVVSIFHSHFQRFAREFAEGRSRLSVGVVDGVACLRDVGLKHHSLDPR